MTDRVINGINFFDNSQACIADFQQTHWIRKALSFIKSVGTLLIYGLHRISLRFRKIEAQMAPYTAPTELSKGRLVICLHGLNNNATQFKQIVTETEQHNLSETTDFFIPNILEKGNAKLTDIVQPIFKKITEWAKQKGDKELVLVGISNGGRVARAIEAQLLNSNELGNIKKIKFVSIVGACQGSSLVNLANRCKLSCLVSRNIAEEMPVDSARNKQLNSEWEAGLKKSSEVKSKVKHEYTFIASPHDWQVPNYNSTLLDIKGQETRYAIIKGHGHNSIVNAAAEAVATIIAES